MLRRAESAEAGLAQAAARARQIRAELAALQAAGQHDPLTGLTNRKGFEDRLAGDLTSPVCLALVDVDGLRGINVSQSPAVGDRLLKVVARALADQCRSHLVSRWEGGTVALLGEGMDLHAAGEMVTAACEMIGAREMKVRESDEPLGRISLSAGVVTARGRDAPSLIKAAQQQLRRAKQAGPRGIATEAFVTPILRERGCHELLVAVAIDGALPARRDRPFAKANGGFFPDDRLSGGDPSTRDRSKRIGCGPAEEGKARGCKAEA
ncbi:GGDEF domain-containing protein [Sphingomonas phyllosphaerae]|uniref:GGDEF domain-containing protein n=1 Tax=Sphingomonas phyllosphaerae TaxID=257003 RepID=UPI003D6A1B51